MLKRIPVLIVALGFLFAGLPNVVIAEPEAGCPCFNAMFAAGACERLVEQEAGTCSLIGNNLTCSVPGSGSSWSFSAGIWSGQDGYCAVVHENKGTARFIIVRAPFSGNEISPEEVEACRVEQEVAELLLEC